MKKLKAMEIIDIKPGTHFSIITILNWDKYQGKIGENEHPTEHPTDTQRTRNGHPTDTHKNEEKAKKVKKFKGGGVDDLYSWREAEKIAAKFQASQTFKIHGTTQPARESDRCDILKACFLALSGEIKMEWLEEVATRTRSEKPYKDAYRLFLTLARKTCRLHEVDLEELSANLTVPMGLRCKAPPPNPGLDPIANRV